LSALALPNLALALLAAAIVGTMLPDLPGVISGALAASLLMAYALVGFAVLHTVTRGLQSRPFILSGTYASVVMLGWPVLAMTLLGLADALIHIRARVAARRGPPDRNRPNNPDPNGV
jgi:mannose/fructose/N-acetylgalactosamine-specific phosphotransferase system component IIC